MAQTPDTTPPNSLAALTSEDGRAADHEINGVTFALIVWRAWRRDGSSYIRQRWITDDRQRRATAAEARILNRRHGGMSTAARQAQP